MQTTAASGLSSGLGLQALRDLFQTRTTSDTGQNSPTERPKGPPPGPPPSGPPPADMAGGGFSSDTLSSLLGLQEEDEDAASTLLSSLDSDASGDLSLDEIGAALGETDTSALTDIFASLDSDGDGAMSAEELSAGLESAQGPHGHRPPPPASSDDMAASVIDASDANADGVLTADEIASALGEDDATALSEAFASLDSDGDSQLTSTELSAALQSMLARQAEAYGQQTTAAGQTTSIAA